jgi:hypothetical protein
VGLVTREAPVRQKALLQPYEAAFVMVALGFVAHEVIGEVEWLDSVFHFVPGELAALVPGVPFGWFEALWFLVLFPLAVWAAITGVSLLAGHRAGLRSLLLAAATGAAPIVAVAHLAKAVAKISAWGGYPPPPEPPPTRCATSPIALSWRRRPWWASRSRAASSLWFCDRLRALRWARRAGGNAQGARVGLPARRPSLPSSPSGPAGP